MKVELHLVQNFSPACLNRDDTNSPKDCEFGGYRRARISSQCLKRAIRWDPSFRETLADHLSFRSRRFPAAVAQKLQSDGVSAERASEVGSALEGIARSAGTQSAAARASGQYDLDIFRTPQSVFYTDNEVQLCAEKVQSELSDDADIPAIVRGLRFPTPRSADIAMFGRMVTSDAFENIDGACQVAHAISTNQVSMETDYFTAVDDLQPDDESGADMIGIVGFNSSCFYRYSLIDMSVLHQNIDGKELELLTLQAFLKASIAAIPSGKQNSMAAYNPPEAMLAVVRSGGTPVSLANAFSRPVRPSREKSLIQTSVEALDQYWGQVTKVYGEDGVAARPVCLVTPADLSALADQQVDTVTELIDRVVNAVGNE